MEVPQLPVISVVMPWKSLLSGWKLSRGQASEWLWMSMKPGATVSPDTSTTSRASSPLIRGDAGDAPSRMHTSAA